MPTLRDVALVGLLAYAGLRPGEALALRWRDIGRVLVEVAGVRAAPYDGRHTYASLLIHEGRALPYVTAALGHASATTTLDHYAHVFDEARLAPAVGMVDAIRNARADLERRGVYPMCTRRPGRALRAPAETP